MTQAVTDLLDQTLMTETFQTPEQAVSYVLQNAPPYETITVADELWMLNQARQQFSNGLSIKLFQGKAGENIE